MSLSIQPSKHASFAGSGSLGNLIGWRGRGITTTNCKCGCRSATTSPSRKCACLIWYEHAYQSRHGGQRVFWLQLLEIYRSMSITLKLNLYINHVVMHQKKICLYQMKRLFSIKVEAITNMQWIIGVPGMVWDFNLITPITRWYYSCGFMYSFTWRDIIYSKPMSPFVLPASGKA